MFFISARSALGGGRARRFGGFGGSRTNYVYLPGQTLAPEAIYFDHRADVTNLTDAYLKHFDAVVQVMPDAEVGAAQQKMLDSFKSAGNGADQVHRRPASGGCGPARSRARCRQQEGASRIGKLRSPRVLRCSVCRARCRITSAAPEPVKYQAPLSPKDSMRYTQVPADFDLQLFAAEPDIVKPIYMAWDERGRAWVVEARDYPHGLVAEGEPGHDSIKICEDTDGDGKADKFTVFADKLNLATALVFVNGGIIVSEARHMLFLKDTDGDDKADVREAILPGWGTGDTHAMQSNLGRGFDNWLYGAVGYSNFRGNVGGKDLQFGQGVFRFKADGSALEFLHQFNNNTWGFGLNAHGDVFGSTANGQPDLLRLSARAHPEPDAAGLRPAWRWRRWRRISSRLPARSGQRGRRRCSPMFAGCRPPSRWLPACGCIPTRRTSAWWITLAATRPRRDTPSWSAMRCRRACKARRW